MTKNGWLAVSEDGFAQQNAGREKGHLVKELVQNGLDAISGPGRVRLTFADTAPGMKICCEDTGGGIENMDTLRTVFWTSKQDSHLKRGRLGRGFKEMLCLAQRTEVESGDKTAVFSIDGGKREFQIRSGGVPTAGTRITMWLDWEYKTTAEELHRYFEAFLPPAGVGLQIDETEIPHRTPKHVVKTSLTTEAFSKGRWVKPSAKTNVELVPSGAAPGMIYEMGIPICPVEWEAPYHANILQRVPMNPNRDAVMSGFPAKIHKACLPTILEEMSSDEARAAWVGEAAARTTDETLQKEVLSKAFGENLARSVPNFGKFNHDADAEESAGAKILDTKQLSGGFRELARTHIPTSSDVAKAVKEEKRTLASENGEDPGASTRYAGLLKKYGRKHVQNVCEFHRWMANLILADLFPGEARSCKVKVADFNGTAEGTWSDNFQILTLALDLERIWKEPMDRENFALLIHETAHELAAHHGNSFARAMETTAGAAIKALFAQREELGRWDANLAPTRQNTTPARKKATPETVQQELFAAA